MKRILVTFAFATIAIAGFAQKSRIVEEGGTGPYKAIMKEEASIAAHTIFVPQDLT